MNKLITGLHDRLMSAIDDDLDVFLEERPFLESGELVITSSPKSKQTDMEIKKTAQALKKAVDETLPPVEPPKQLDLHT